MRKLKDVLKDIEQTEEAAYGSDYVGIRDYYLIKALLLIAEAIIRKE